MRKRNFIFCLKKAISKLFRTIFSCNHSIKPLNSIVPECELPYIPERLHQGNRGPISTFEVGEHLYFRCNAEVLDNPYKSISITELSHNRKGLSSETLSNPDDVLFNINLDETEERYTGLEICTIEIKSLDSNYQYVKNFTESKNNVDHNCTFKLIHDPAVCMYPHCVFRVWINNELITYDNYNQTIKKLNKIRAFLKEDLASMILQRELQI